MRYKVTVRQAMDHDPRFVLWIHILSVETLEQY